MQPDLIYEIMPRHEIESKLAQNTTKLSNIWIDVKQDFGAKGDGVTDDTTALQNALVSAFRNNCEVYFPVGNYLISKPLLVFGKNYELDTSLILTGEDIEHTVITCSSNFTTHQASGILSNKAAIIVVNDTFIQSDNTFINGDGATGASNIHIDKFKLMGNSSVDYGILFGVYNAESTYKRMRIRGFAKAGMKNLNHFYLNVVERMRVDLSPISYDFELTTGVINTSVRFDSLYSFGATDTAYKIAGIYMNMTNCCADNCTGTVFDLTGFRGVVNNPGSESYSALTMFKGSQYTNVVINGAYTWGNFDSASAIHVNAGSGAVMVFNGGSILFDRTESNKIAPGMFISRGTQSYVKFIGTIIGNYATNNTTKDLTMRTSYELKEGSIHSRFVDDIAYIGVDGQSIGGFVDHNSSKPVLEANAIYMGLGTSLSKTNNNKDIQWEPYTMKGDILLSKSPKDIGGIGWIQGDDVSGIGGARWITGTYLKIPVILSGSTTNRPTINLSIGQDYFDTTINKPVWVKAKGTQEVDTLTVNSAATVTGNITVTLNGVATTVSISAGDLAGTIGDKIRATAFTGWTVSGTAGSATVTFTKLGSGTNTTPTFADTGTTGATGSFAVTTAGVNATWVDATGATV